MEKKELTLEAFRRELGARFNKWYGHWREKLFESLLNKYDFEEDKIGRGYLRMKLKKLGFFEGKFNTFNHKLG